MKKQIKEWIPLITTLLFSLSALIFYSIFVTDKNYIIYWQVAAASLVPAILPVFSKITKKPYPIFINWVIVFHIFLSSSLGSALMFYHRFPLWDLIMHALFGFNCAVVIYGITYSKPNLILIFLSVMGCAALWEVFEYTCDILFDGDAQRVKIAMARGVNPIKDTMTDIAVTMSGIILFYILLIIDRRFNNRISKILRKCS